MASIDNRIVFMKFENSEFEKKVSGTMSTLDKLKERLSFKGAAKGLTDINDATKNIKLDGMASAVDNISSKFSALGAVGFTVIQDLTRSAMGFASKVAGMALDPILSGGRNRALNIEQAKFMFEGLGMDVTSAMESARKAVTGTAFGLDSAAKAAGRLGGSGIKAGDEMTGALRGIAGIAAMTGSSYDEMADVFTAAAGKGKVSGYELQRIGQRGVNAASKLAEVWGLTEQEVRKMATDGEISFKMFAEGMDEAFGEHATKANQTYTGSLANLRAAFGRIGATFFTERLEQQRNLFNALTPVIDNVHEALKPLINAITTMMGLTNLGAIQKLENMNLDKLTRMVKVLVAGLTHAFMAMHLFAKSIRVAFQDVFPKHHKSMLLNLIRGFRDLMKYITPTLHTMISIRNVFRGVFSIFAIGIEIIKVLARSFVTIFKALNFGSSKEGSSLLKFFSNFGDKIFALKKILVDDKGIENFFELFIPKIAKFASGIDLSPGLEKLGWAFTKLKDILVGLFNLVKESSFPTVIGKIVSAITGFASAVVGIFSSGAGDSMELMGSASERLAIRWGFLIPVAKAIGNAFSWVFEVLKKLGNKVSEAMKDASGALSAPSFSAIGTAAGVGIAAGIALGLRKLYKKLTKMLDFGSLDSWRQKIDAMLGSITKVLSDMQMKLKSEALLNIAIAIAVLTASLLVLSMIDSAALARALAAVAVGMAELAIMIKIMTGTEMSTKKLLAVSMALIAIGAAIFILSLSLLILSTIDGDKLAIALLAIGALLAGLVAVVEKMPKNDDLIKTSIGIGFLAGALLLLTIPVKLLSMMEPKELIRGLLGVGGLMLGITVLMKNMPTKDKMISTGIGIGIIAASILLLTAPVYILAKLDPLQLLQGMAAIVVLMAFFSETIKTIDGDKLKKSAGALLVLAVAVALLVVPVKMFGEMDFWVMLQGIGAVLVLLFALGEILKRIDTKDMKKLGWGLALMAASIKVIGDVVVKFGEMDTSVLAQGIGALAVVFLLIVGALAVLEGMKADEQTAVTLLALAAAILVIGLALEQIGNLGIGTILLALAALAGAFLVIGVAAVLLKPLIPVIAALGAAVAGFGFGILALASSALVIAGAFWIFVKALQELVKLVADSRDKLLETIAIIIDTIGDILVAIFDAIGRAIVEFIKTLPEIVRELGKVIDAILDVLIESQPKFFQFVGDLITNILNLIREKGPEFLLLGWDMLLNFLKGIRDNIYEMTNVVIDILLTFHTALIERMPELVASGADVFISFLKGLQDKVPEIIEEAANLIVSMIDSMADQSGDILDAGINFIIKLLEGLAERIDDIITAGVDLVIAFILGMGSEVKRIIKAGVWMAGEILDGAASSAVGFVNKAAKVLIAFLDGLAEAIRTHSTEINRAVRGLADAIVDGLVTVLLGEDGKKKLVDAAKALGKTILGPFARFFGIESPSKLMMKQGGYIIDGLLIGLEDNKRVMGSSEEMAENVVSIFKNSLGNLADIVEEMDEFNPRITPVLDLSNVKAGAHSIGELMGEQTLQASSSLAQARLISEERGRRSKEQSATESSSEYIFNQTINAPRELRTGDIYRATKSQLILAKEVAS